MNKKNKEDGQFEMTKKEFSFFGCDGKNVVKMKRFNDI